MAVPKKRTGASAQGHRRSNWKATKPEVAKCTNCGETVLSHTVCTACGYYKGKAASIKSPDYVESKLEAKKPVKKAAPKAEKAKKATEVKVEEVKTAETVVEETIVEEVKAETELKVEEEK